jgi:hypothetical protein
MAAYDQKPTLRQTIHYLLKYRLLDLVSVVSKEIVPQKDYLKIILIKIMQHIVKFPEKSRKILSRKIPS